MCSDSVLTGEMITREFRVADLDGNQLRVFYDFNWEMSEERRR